MTVKQESLYKVIMQEQDISGPPKYFTTDWVATEKSVKELADLKPKLVITGHGKPMFGEALEKNLRYLIENFNTIAVPEHGRYIM